MEKYVVISPSEVISAIYDQWYLFVLLSCIISFVLASLVKNMSLGFMDPIHFFWTFTFGTSYSIVVLLFLNDFIDIYLFLIVIIYFFTLILFMYVGYYSKKINFNLKLVDNFCSINTAIKILFFLIFMYLVFLVYYVINVNWNVFFISRFEANRGIGFIARILDLLRLFIIYFLAVYCVHKKNLLSVVFLFVFLIVSSFFNGAKFSILESVYLILLVYCIFLGKNIKINIKNTFKFSVLVIFVLSFSLFFTNKLAIEIGYSSNYTNLPPAVEMLLSRIIANGDIYYMGMVNNLVFTLSDKISSFFELVARPYLGYELTKYIFDSNNDSLNIGRAVWEYWYPYSVSGGSIDHFDIAAFAYFGLFGGVAFVSMMGFFLGRINKYKKKLMYDTRKNILNIGFFSIIYIKCYLLLLSPVVAITTMFDIFLCFILLNMILILMKKG